MLYHVFRRFGFALRQVYPAWLAVYLNEDPAETKELEKTMMDRWVQVTRYVVGWR